MYIAIEGVKGVGKTTVIKHLQQMLNGLGADNFAILSPTRPMPATHALELQYDDLEDNDSLREQLYAHRSNYHASCANWQADMIIGDSSIITSLAVRWHRVSQGISATAYFEQVRAKEHLIGIPDTVIQLDCDTEELLKRYVTRQRDYGSHEECWERVTMIKHHYQAVKNWLATPEAVQLIGKSIDWFSIDTSQYSYLETLEQVFSIIEMSRKKSTKS
ncbi:AAA family ATPase [Faucicola atlantae]|uniref:Thymidylate kinase-like domain-containing protein n=1 Tax=Faucicola atlantae TaxID=34059 RepID=A0A1B8QEX1_9GAMM|nr:AAA family ATPase [Moraxella atlantae]OBX80517.1 hypothetical protein A9306_07405 [Moraxella atlantae]